MSGISKNIRKITKAWGGETTGSGIGDAVRDLYDNLPFSVMTEMVEILPEQSVTVDEQFAAISIKYNFEPGKNYTVIFDNEEYNCIAYIYEGNGFISTVIGNAELIGGNGGNKEPFFCAVERIDCLVASSVGVHTIKIVGVVDKVAKLDGKFMPDTTIHLKLNGFDDVISGVAPVDMVYEYSCEEMGFSDVYLHLMLGKTLNCHIQTLIEGFVVNATAWYISASNNSINIGFSTPSGDREIKWRNDNSITHF